LFTSVRRRIVYGRTHDSLPVLASFHSIRSFN
jgi:hypothetical protein